MRYKTDLKAVQNVALNYVVKLELQNGSSYDLSHIKQLIS